MSGMVSLRVRILFVVGSLLIVTALIISSSLFYQWRKLMIEDQRKSAQLVCQAFSISILDALIYQENDLLQTEDYLENYFLHFQKENDQIRFIAVYDPDDVLITHSKLFLNENNINPVKRGARQKNILSSSIYEHKQYGWLIEAQQPLQVAGKSWGTLYMGFDARSLRDDIRNVFILFFSLTSISILIILSVLYSLISKLTRSLRTLVYEMNNLELEQNMPVEIPSSNDEIGVLIKNFKEMKTRLAQSREQIINAQKQIYQAEKLASIGRLASGVAHEINNPLNGIKSCIYAINKDPDDHRQTAEYMNLIDEGLTHIETIVKKLLGFARKPAKSRSAVDINEALHKVLQLLEFRLTQKKVQLKLCLDDNIPGILADQHLIQEVFMNLLLNSFDAVPEDGKIEISTKALQKKTIQISIKDNGDGISPEDQKKIFDPFFTTKELGKGTGLGLSVSLSIIEAHNGSIKFKSSAVKGSEFIINLPYKENI